LEKPAVIFGLAHRRFAHCNSHGWNFEEMSLLEIADAGFPRRTKKSRRCQPHWSGRLDIAPDDRLGLFARLSKHAEERLRSRDEGSL
jgi:hypothetical protein